jgi:hypothetical protein
MLAMASMVSRCGAPAVRLAALAVGMMALAASACGGGDACGCLCAPDSGLVAPCSTGVDIVDATAQGDDAAAAQE